MGRKVTNLEFGTVSDYEDRRGIQVLADVQDGIRGGAHGACGWQGAFTHAGGAGACGREQMLKTTWLVWGGGCRNVCRCVVM
jgi:hypothetical protein